MAQKARPCWPEAPAPAGHRAPLDGHETAIGPPPGSAGRSAAAADARLNRAPLGLYLSVPFCPTKCSFCNFASDVGTAGARAAYAELLLREIELALPESGNPPPVDSIYWGGGTPSLLALSDWQTLAAALQARCRCAPGAEHTLEAAPGTLTAAAMAVYLRGGVNRVSLGVQSFVDSEAAAVGRRHDRATVLADIARLRAAGIDNINVDLIAGLPLQTEDSWRESLEVAIATGVPHLSVYLLEVDGDSRLGRELLRHGHRYHAGEVPDDDSVAGFYEIACRRLEQAGLAQYEISNFARPGFASRHNERYWLRQPYLGLGLEAHSFLTEPAPHRFANPDELAAYEAPLRAGRLPRQPAVWVDPAAALEEALFLGLRRNAGLAPRSIEAEFGPAAADWLRPRLERLADAQLLAVDSDSMRLTARGRLLSNEVFAEFVGAPRDIGRRRDGALQPAGL